MRPRGKCAWTPTPRRLVRRELSNIGHTAWPARSHGIPSSPLPGVATDAARTEAFARSSVGADRLFGGLAGAFGPLAARRSRVRFSLLLVSAVGICLPDRRHGQLRRAVAGSWRSAVPAAGGAGIGRRAGRFAGVRVGLPIRFFAGPLGENHEAQNRAAAVDGAFSLRGAGWVGAASAGDPRIQRDSF